MPVHGKAHKGSATGKSKSAKGRATAASAKTKKKTPGLAHGGSVRGRRTTGPTGGFATASGSPTTTAGGLTAPAGFVGAPGGAPRAPLCAGRPGPRGSQTAGGNGGHRRKTGINDAI